MILQWFKNCWDLLNRIHPETRSLMIVLLFGWILYSLITRETAKQIDEKHHEELIKNKKAEQYSIDTAVEINLLVQLISERDKDAFDVILLNYHNNTLSLQGYKYLYLSCLTEAPSTLDTPTLKLLWNKLDYIYYADELAKIHGQSFVQFETVEQMGKSLPKLYRLVKASDAQAVSFFTVEGHNSQIGLVILFYKEYKKYNYQFARGILPCIQRLAILLDYEQVKK